MKVSVGKLARRNLDVEMKPFRLAGLDKHSTKALLRAVRKALRMRFAGDLGEDGDVAVGGVRYGEPGSERNDYTAGDRAVGGRDGLQDGVRGGAEGRADAGGTVSGKILGGGVGHGNSKGKG